MKYVKTAIVVILVLMTLSASAQYTRANRLYTTPVRQYAISSCATVSVEQLSPSCYRDGIQQCKRLNSGKCFTDCAQQVRNVCFDPTRLPSCTLPAGFETKYVFKNECVADAKKSCARTCTTGNLNNDCQRQAYAKCSTIGRIFI